MKEKTVTESDSQGAAECGPVRTGRGATVYAQETEQVGAYISKELSPIGGVVVIAPGGDKAQVKQTYNRGG